MEFLSGLWGKIIRREELRERQKVTTIERESRRNPKKPVLLRRISDGKLFFAPSLYDASMFLHTDESNIKRCIRGKYRHVKGYVATWAEGSDAVCTR